MKVVIVGGVAAGASTAARLRRLDEKATIILLERGKHVSFANCGLPYHIGGDIADREDLLLQTPQSLRQMLNLDVRTGHEAISVDRAGRKVEIRETVTGGTYQESYDKLVLCPGASPVRPRIPGVDRPDVFVLRSIEDMDEIKKAVNGGAKAAVVVGGGYIGVEMAENLKSRGMTVDLVEMLDQVMPVFDREIAHDLEQHMRWNGVTLHLGESAAAIGDDNGKARVELVGGKMLVADIVIMAVGVRPESDLAARAGLELGKRGGIRVDQHMRTSDPDIYAAGDAVEVTDAITREPAQIPLAGPANRQGRIVADNLAGIKSVYIATQGSAVVKVFGMTGACTGATEKSLKRSGIPFRKVYLHPSGHASYYPGTAPMHMKVLFDPDRGRLLGAQIAGYDGVDKRVDVLATAIRAGMTVHDIKDLELTYAPPYGSAKDPVNMAGFIGSNLLNGLLELWYAEDYPACAKDGAIVDVRSVEEYSGWHIPGAINIPVSGIRSRIGDVPKDKPLYVYCKVGFRSYLAYRILKQFGFDHVVTLAGGLKTFCAYHGSGICTGEPQPPVTFYAEEPPVVVVADKKIISLDCSSLQCPGPIRKLSEKAAELAAGDEIVVTVTDPGFASDVKAWCRKGGHELLELSTGGKGITARIRKGVPAKPASAQAAAAMARPDKKTFVVFSGDLDKVLAAFVIANGAISMGSQVTMFFTFWGLNALRKSPAPAVNKGLIDRMFGMMMPEGARNLTLSKMHMLGAGTAMMKSVMQKKHVDSLPEMIEQARTRGAKLVACSMSMDIMGLKKEELLDGVEIGGVAAFLSDADESGTTLFI